MKYGAIIPRKKKLEAILSKFCSHQYKGPLVKSQNKDLAISLFLKNHQNLKKKIISKNLEIFSTKECIFFKKHFLRFKDSFL